MSGFQRSAIRQTRLGSLESGCDGGRAVGPRGIGTVGQVVVLDGVVLDGAEVRLDRSELGAIGWPVGHSDALGGQRRAGLLNDAADAAAGNRGIVEDDHQRRPQTSEGADKHQQVLRGQAVRDRPPPERRWGSVREQGRQRVAVAPVRVLGGKELALAGQPLLEGLKGR